MAVYTALEKNALTELIDDYGLVRVIASHGIPSGSVNSNYLLETPRGKHLLRVARRAEREMLGAHAVGPGKDPGRGRCGQMTDARVGLPRGSRRRVATAILSPA